MAGADGVAVKLNAGGAAPVVAGVDWTVPPKLKPPGSGMWGITQGFTQGYQHAMKYSLDFNANACPGAP